MYEKSAIISEDTRYRYELRRIWQTKTGLVAWVMLNPSTADANVDDPTIRRCMGYTARWGYGGMIIVNLFALRSTNSNNLYRSTQPIGQDNDQYIIRASDEAAMTIAAWGDKGEYLKRDEFIMSILVEPYYLALTKKGNPCHPLYLLKGLEPILAVPGPDTQYNLKASLNLILGAKNE